MRAIRGILGMLAAALVVCGLSTMAAAQGLPKSIKLVYPFAAGSTGDVLARLVADRMAAALGVAIIVENKTGAAGRLGVQAVIGAEGDGATLLFTSNPVIVIHPHTYAGQLGYDTFKDLKPVSQVATFDVALVVAPNVEAKAPQAFVGWLKANPDKGSYGSPGAGGLGHFLAVNFARSAGVEIQHVSYRGSSAVMNDLIGGQIPFGFVPTGDALEQHKAGRARILATSGAVRSPLTPDVPTFKESGLAVEGEGWYALYAPARTPDALVEALSKVAASAAQAPEIKERLLALALVATGTSASDLGKLQVADSERWGPAIKASGFKPQQ